MFINGSLIWERPSSMQKDLVPQKESFNNAFTLHYLQELHWFSLLAPFFHIRKAYWNLSNVYYIFCLLQIAQ